MQTIKTIDELREIVKQWKDENLTVGLVPTMGFLHEGHASLIERAYQECDRIVVSDFVNPTQFGPTEDLASYPRDLEHDILLCEKAGADLIFHPEVSEMYYENASTFVDMGGPSEELCGKSRPVHFRGVCTVVAKLFLIVSPDRAYFGQKDAQQLAVIKRMVRDLNFDIEIIGCPIIRENDGLAKSSRNTYLSETERSAALILNKALTIAREEIADGQINTKDVIERIVSVIQTEPLAKIDYVKIVSYPEIEPVNIIDGPILTAIAVYIGKTRLIDNFILE